MAEEMSRRQWFGLVGGLLAAFGLLPRAPKQSAANKLPEVQPTVPSLHYQTYLGGTDYLPRGGTVTYVYDASSRLFSTNCPTTHVTTFTYRSATWRKPL
jgi:YD repeat-containing protein